MSEMDLLNAIRLKLQERGCLTFRINVGSGVTKHGNYFSTGVKPGFSDICGVRHDGKAFFIETKVAPRKPTKEQCNFLLSVIKHNACGGVAYTVQDAIDIVRWDLDTQVNMIHKLRGYYD